MKILFLFLMAVGPIFLFSCDDLDRQVMTVGSLPATSYMRFAIPAVRSLSDAFRCELKADNVQTGDTFDEDLSFESMFGDQESEVVFESLLKRYERIRRQDTGPEKRTQCMELNAALDDFKKVYPQYKKVEDDILELKEYCRRQTDLTKTCFANLHHLGENAEQ